MLFNSPEFIFVFLPVTLYHKPEDVETIPRYLAGLNLGYRFYLEHHTICNNETVLFGVP